MSQPILFTPFHVGGLELENRIVIAPMCQYSAVDGCMTDWHLIHLGQLALSGAALLTIEATAVTPEGRISYADVGLYDDVTEKAMDSTVSSIRKWSKIPIAIQLAHAGRKASTEKPWLGEAQITPDRPNGWQTVAPSALPMYSSYLPPLALDRQDMASVRGAFASAARRADRIGIDAFQIHAAHGYLLHEFLSPHSNHRTDEYGGPIENRMRFPLEVFETVREAVSPSKPVTVRLSASDWVSGGWNLEQTIQFSRRLEEIGCAAIHVSSGGLHPDQKIPVGPNYQVPLARAIKQSVAMPVVAVGMITEPTQAEAIVATGDADFVAIARAALYDPRWPWHAAAALGAQVTAPPQYFRCQPPQHKALFKS